MTTTPDPKTVREIAQEVANLALHDAVHVDQWISAVVNGRFGNECSSFRAPLHAAVARRMAVVKPSWPDEQPQDERDARIAELEREVRQLRAGAPRAWKQDWRNPISRFETFVNATRNYDSDHLGGIMRGGNAEATITLGDLRAVLARLAELEAHPWIVVEAEQPQDDGDVRAVAALLKLGDTSFRGNWLTDYDDARSELESRFAARIAALDARDAKAGEQR